MGLGTVVYAQTVEIAAYRSQLLVQALMIKSVGVLPSALGARDNAIIQCIFIFICNCIFIFIWWSEMQPSHIGVARILSSLALPGAPNILALPMMTGGPQRPK